MACLVPVHRRADRFLQCLAQGYLVLWMNDLSVAKAFPSGPPLLALADL